MSTLPPIFSCEALHARLTVKACGARYLTVRSSPKGSAGFDSACDNCPIGAHHAKHGTLFPGKEYTEAMAPPPKWTEEQQRAAVRRVIVGQEKRAAVARDIGVTATSITNWCNRFEAEIAREEVERVGTEPVSKADAPTPSSRGRVRVDATVPKPVEPPDDDIAVAVAQAVMALLRARNGGVIGTPGPLRVRGALAELGDTFAAAVCSIEDKHGRAELGDAAWLLASAAEA